MFVCVCVYVCVCVCVYLGCCDCLGKHRQSRNTGHCPGIHCSSTYSSTCVCHANIHTRINSSTSSSSCSNSSFSSSSCTGTDKGASCHHFYGTSLRSARTCVRTTYHGSAFQLPSTCVRCPTHSSSCSAHQTNIVSS